MFIQNYQDMLIQIKNKILNKELKYENTIIIGGNSSGKSEILKALLINQESNYYFIDSINRSFNFEKVSKLDDLKNTYKSVIKGRLSTENFNLLDTFNVYGVGTDAIEKVYFNYEKEIGKLLNDFLDIDFRITINKDKIIGDKKILDVDNGIDKLSSGYQSIIRMFLELIYFEDSLEDNSGSGVVVIDEINEFLSVKNEERILPFLLNRFNNMNFIVTTHSADVIASAVDFNIIVLKNNNYECLDGNDFSTVTDVREIFEDLYNLKENDEIIDTEILLRHLLNSKIGETWTKIEEDKLEQIDENTLSNSQKLILNQVKSW